MRLYVLWDMVSIGNRPEETQKRPGQGQTAVIEQCVNKKLMKPMLRFFHVMCSQKGPTNAM